MGMGEPAHNLDAVLEAIDLLGTGGAIGHKNRVDLRNKARTQRDRCNRLDGANSFRDEGQGATLGFANTHINRRAILCGIIAASLLGLRRCDAHLGRQKS
jgi:hypothetical protein